MQNFGIRQSKKGGDKNQPPFRNKSLKGSSVCSKAVKPMKKYADAGSKGVTVVKY